MAGRTNTAHDAYLTAGQRHRCGGARKWAAVGAAFFVPGSLASTGNQEQGGWWPEQAKPAEIITIPQPNTPAERILAEGLAGLWARAVNEGREDTLIWIDRNPHYRDWLDETVDRLGARSRTLRRNGSVDELFQTTRSRGLVQGYVVYRLGDPGEEPLDHSVNIATMLAGVLDAVIVEEDLVSEMPEDFPQLADARLLDYEGVWEEYAGDFSPDLLFLLSPGNDARIERMRDMVVAHRGRVAYGTDDTTAAAMLETSVPATAFGWNEGGEFGHISQASRHGLLNTVSDWLANVTVMSAGSRDYQPAPISTLDPAAIDWEDDRFPVSFLMSDGDNTGWVARGFWGHPSGSPHGVFWDHPEHGDFPMGFTVATSDLADFAPVVIDRLAATKPEHTTVVHFSSYFYPDLFALEREEREEALRKVARTKARQMERTGAHVLTFIAADTAGSGTHEAMRIFAEEIRPLLGMLIIDFDPYNANQGEIFWIDDGQGGEVPAVTPRYALWHELNAPNAGEPEEVAGFMNQDHDQFEGAWAAVHAWSQFPRPDGPGADQGIPAVRRAVDAVDPDKVNVVSPEEMLWRLRVSRNRHDAQRINEEIHRLPPGSSAPLGSAETFLSSGFDPADGQEYAPDKRPPGWGGDANSSYPIRRWAFDPDRGPVNGSGYFAEVVREPTQSGNAWEMSSRFPTEGQSTYTVTFDFKPASDPEINAGEIEGDVDFVYRNWNSDGGYLGPDINLALYNATGAIGEPGFNGTNDFARVTVGDPDARGWRTIEVTGTTTSGEARFFDLWFVGRNNFSGSFGIDNVTVTNGISGLSRLEAWRLHHFGTIEGTGDFAHTGDPDGDGVRNLMEFALGRDPNQPGGPPVVLGEDNGFPTLTFRHIGAPDLSYRIEAGDHPGGTWSPVYIFPGTTQSGIKTYTDTVPLGEQSARFLRLSVTFPD